MNTIVIKTFESVADNNLLKLDAICIDAGERTWSNQVSSAITVGQAINAISRDSVFKDWDGSSLGAEIELAEGVNYVLFSSDGGTYDIFGKEHISAFINTIPNITIRSRSLVGCNALTTLRGVIITGELKDVGTLSNIENINITYSGSFGNIGSLANLTSLETLEIAGDDVSGYLRDLGSDVALTTLAIGPTKIRGSIESFVIEQRAYGRTVCESMAVPYIGASFLITFKDEVIASNPNSVLAWTADTITLDGVTINV